MSLDTPARIAILGAGPTGLEAALYARFLGYDCDVYERGRVGENLLLRGRQPLAVPWRLIPSPLGLEALAAQDPSWQPPADDAVLTCEEIVSRYYLPLAQSDLLVDGVRTQTRVLSVSREGPSGKSLAREDLRGDETRADHPFRILLRGAGGEEQVATADAVLDCTGLDDAASSNGTERGEPTRQDPPHPALSHRGRGFSEDLLAPLQTELLEPAGSSAVGPARLLRVEPDFYILGAKSSGGSVEFTFADGLVQVRDLFTIIGDRATLDLYATMRPLR